MEMEVANLGNRITEEYGYVYSRLNIEPKIQGSENDTTVMLGTQLVEDVFTTTLSDLQEQSIYYVRPYALLGGKEIYGEVVSFQTGKITVVTDQTVRTNFNSRHAIGTGILNLDGDSLKLSHHGLCWSLTNQLPTTADDTTDLGERSQNGIFSSIMRELQTNRRYYMRAYATHDGETYYGDTISFILETIWETRTGFLGAERGFAASFAIGKTGYMGTGWSRSILSAGDIRFFQDFWAYDTEADTWTQIKDFPELRSFAVSFALDGLGYVGLGFGIDSTYRADLWAYDPSGNDWIEVAPFPGAAREGSFAFTIDDKAYVGSGEGVPVNNQSYHNDFWEFDPARPPNHQWQQLTNFRGVPRVYASSFSIGEKGYVGGGIVQFLIDAENSGVSITPLADFWEYDVRTDVWTQRGEIAQGQTIGSAVSFALNGKGYIVTGALGDIATTNALWEFDPNGLIWQELEPFRGGIRATASGFVIPSTNKAYIGLGLKGEFPFPWQKDLWEPESGVGNSIKFLMNETAIKDHHYLLPYIPSGM